MLFVSAGLEARFQRAVLPALASEEELQASFKRCSSHVQESQERERAHSRVVLNCPGLDIAHRRLVQSERRYGAEPRPCPGFLGWNLRDPIFHSFRGRYKLTDFICMFSRGVTISQTEPKDRDTPPTIRIAELSWRTAVL